ncbi:autophagy-related protein 9-like, partial [Trifolium medium]|nr:autophagy-related protein 9-like [Trifolium medium]
MEKSLLRYDLGKLVVVIRHINDIVHSLRLFQQISQGKQFLLNLRTFKEKKLSVHGNRHGSSPPRMWRGSPNMAGNGDRN